MNFFACIPLLKPPKNTECFLGDPLPQRNLGPAFRRDLFLGVPTKMRSRLLPSFALRSSASVAVSRCGVLKGGLFLSQSIACTSPGDPEKVFLSFVCLPSKREVAVRSVGFLSSVISKNSNSETNLNHVSPFLRKRYVTAHLLRVFCLTRLHFLLLFSKYGIRSFRKLKRVKIEP